MVTPDSLEGQLTLMAAAARYDELRTRDAVAGAAGEEPPLSREEALELLALGEVITRKASYGRQLDVRSARAAGASWSQIGAALGTTKQAAWEAHSRWIDGQSARHRRAGFEGLDESDMTALRTLAGNPDE